MGVIELLHQRRSVRGFLPRPVPRDLVLELLRAAARSPSGTNMQPWRVYVFTGQARDRLVQEVLAKREQEPFREKPPKPFGEYDYNPEPLFEPYLSRRRTVGFALYQLLGVARGDRAASWTVAGRNFEFFGAPVGLIFTIDRSLQQGSWLDYGIFLQSLMLAASDVGLDTCAQAAWRHYHDVIRPICKLPENEIVVCGMSLGYGDHDAPANKLATEREPVENFATFIDVAECQPPVTESNRHAPV
ncbi:nitroreductase [Bradyrhizobium sp. Arg237L]|uniref:nitroreductase n=1 Tax=Bradyrhizobium sp. Arg237L TaxID=3003352 RepID=UPI00249E8206|nr:nitroreductase [Bradyrhizobium sp. Arg237L]MDI4237130.1 nitroreductase [Bradyrhizobium sp. Arg237L]